MISNPPRRAGLVTIMDNTNYGNRLQNWALARVISDAGFSVDTIDNQPDPASGVPALERLTSSLAHDGLGSMLRIARNRLSGRSPNSENAGHRVELTTSAGRADAGLDEFDPGELSIRHAVDLRFMNSDYQAYVVGSDQVWNPHLRLANGADFLRFAPQSLRIAYAASFGVDSLPGHVVRRYRAWLREIPCISVRESAGARIVRDLTGRAVPVVLDPTFLLPQQVWREVARTPHHHSGDPFAFSFFLGSDQKVLHSLALQSSMAAGLNTMSLPHADRGSSPFEFVGAIMRSERVYTNSFHAAVFAIIFEKTVFLWGRANMNSRFETLLEMAGCQEAKELSPLRPVVLTPGSDGYAPGVLRARRVESMAWLHAALSSATHQ